MRRAATLCCTLLLTAVACSKAENTPADTTAAAAAAPPPAPAPMPISLATVAGKWNMKASNQAGDSVLTEYVLDAKADTTGWTITFPNGRPIPVHVRTDADSLIIDAGPYASILRKGQQVTTHGSLRMQDGKLVGATTARYDVKTADSVRLVRVEGTRVP